MEWRLSKMNRGVSFGSDTQSPSKFGASGLDLNSPNRPLDLEELRKRARDVSRRLDGVIDTLADDDELELAQPKLREAEELLKSLQEINKQLSVAGAAPSQIDHYVDKQRQFSQTIQRLRSRLEDKRARAALFSPSSKDAGRETEDISVNMKTLLQDRDNLNDANQSTAQLIAHGLQVRETITRGRMALQNNLSRLQGTVVRFNSIEGLMNVIKRAKIKNTVIIGLVIGLCLCFFIWYSIR